MPYLHIQIAGARDDALAARTAEAAAELTAGQALAGDRPRSYPWYASITDETKPKAEKARYVAAVHAAMVDLLGAVAEHSYVHVADLRASAYGYGGRTQEARYREPLT